MPKKIEGLIEKINNETKKQLKENGYSGITVFSVAKGAGIGAGTVYANFSTKENLVFSCMLEEWDKCHAENERYAKEYPPIEAVQKIYECIFKFCKENENLFKDPAAQKALGSTMNEYHLKLIEKIVNLVKPMINENSFKNKDLAANVIAEMMLKFVGYGKEFSEISEFFEKMIK
jgi:AcrR family transcriptional regulator